jgi:superfamily I DNA and RNA helicase
MYGIGNAFGGICSELLKAAKTASQLPVLYDVVLIDEAQDLPQPFFELTYLVTRRPKRIVYAYDELQNLSDFAMVRAEELFGKKANGHPNVQLNNQAGKPKRDIILPVCYRNSPWALSVAHGLGFGTAREAGLIQMFDEPALWTEIGYENVAGELVRGHDVSLRRSNSATPAYFATLLESGDAVRFFQFPDVDSEMKWLAESIAENRNRDELDCDDILIVVPEAITIRSSAPKIMRALSKFNIDAHLVGVTASRDEVFSPDSVAITSIYRAKGNEAPMVYVVGSDYCQGGFNLARKRNVLFTAITRSRAWVRVSGTGEPMTRLIHEFQKIVEDEFTLRFRYPTSEELKRISTLHSDRSSDEIQEINKDLEALLRIVERVEAGQISLDALPMDAQGLVRRVQNENPRPSRPRRRSH